MKITSNLSELLEEKILKNITKLTIIKRK